MGLLGPMLPHKSRRTARSAGLALIDKILGGRRIKIVDLVCRQAIKERNNLHLKESSYEIHLFRLFGHRKLGQKIGG
jgi:hypothetical protein